ncbi:GNAT family N-acetyltransferase [Saccharicrinis sp. FJH62]|uniref:GNAT family N-acetyltransferase n=1 Tax=Saccharicrinis sp. FJH62 TaxID=3344657 RepID=UPI0035D51027
MGISYSNLIIETDRLLIRPINLDDIEPAYAMNLDADVSKYTGDGGVVSRKEIERRIKEDVLGDYEKYGFGRLAVELKGENEFIGFTGLKYLQELHEVDLGYRLMKKYWGRGIATEAARASLKLGFDKLGLKKILALVLPENSASIRVLDKLKFSFEKNIFEDNHRVRVYSIYNETPLK